MKMKSIIRILLLGALITGAAACEKDSTAVFEDTAAVRMKDNLESIAKVLTAPQNGWYLEYYLNEDLSGATKGGYSLLLKFDGQKVTAWGDLKPSKESATSLYKLTTDNGPVLSFDSFNEVIHYLSSPSGTAANSVGQTGHYQGMGGDFEFLVLKATADTVLLKGKRGGVEMVMLPLDREPSAVIEDILDVSNDMYVSTFYSDDHALGADFDLQNRHVTFSATRGSGESMEKVKLFEVPFLFSDNGIRLPHNFRDLLDEAIEASPELKTQIADVLPALQSGGYAGQRNFAWTTSSISLEAGGSTLNGSMPAGWRSYEDLLGEWELVYNDSGQPFYSAPRTVSITLEQDVYRSSFLMKGVNDLYDVKVQYDLATGNMLILGQIIGIWEPNGNSIYLAPVYARSNAAGTSATWSGWRSTKYGMRAFVDEEASSEAGTIVCKFTTGPAPSATQPITGFALLGETPAGASAGYMSADTYKDWFPFNYRYYALFWVSLTKK